MMNRMMKAEAVFGAQAHERVCVILHADDPVWGGLMERLTVIVRP